MGSLDKKVIAAELPQTTVDKEKDKTKALKVEELLQLILIELRQLNGKIVQ